MKITNVLGVAWLFAAGISIAAPNPLKYETRIVWPTASITVEHAAAYILAPTGYHLISAPTVNASSTAVLKRMIAPATIGRGTLPIDQALLTLAGNDSVLYVDHLHKLVAFGLKESTP